MARSVDDLVNDIIFFEPAGDDFTELELLIEELGQSGGGAAAQPALVTLFERFADADGTAFEAAAELLERQTGQYESRIVSSFRRSPSLTAAKMLSRMLDRGVNAVDGDDLLEVFEDVAGRDGLPSAVAVFLAPYRAEGAGTSGNGAAVDEAWQVTPKSEAASGASSADDGDGDDDYDDYSAAPPAEPAAKSSFADEMSDTWTPASEAVTVVERTTVVLTPKPLDELDDDEDDDAAWPTPEPDETAPATAAKKPAAAATATAKKPAAAAKKPAAAAKKPAPAAKKPAPAAKKPAAKKAAAKKPAAKKPAAKKAAAKKPAAKKAAAKKPAAKKAAAKKPAAKKPAAKKPAAKKPTAKKAAAKKPAAKAKSAAKKPTPKKAAKK